MQAKKVVARDTKASRETIQDGVTVSGWSLQSGVIERHKWALLEGAANWQMTLAPGNDRNDSTPESLGAIG